MESQSPVLPMAPRNTGDQASSPFWSLPAERFFVEVDTDPQRGLSAEQVAFRLASHGPNRLVPRQRNDIPVLLVRQFSSPIVVILARSFS